ncbi:hypothetical protein GQ457_03G020200 [Hibiscus cannabinus]
MVNPSGGGNQSLDFHGIPNGRPPENITDLSGLPILERPASPLELEEQQIAKKSKGDGTRVDVGGVPCDATNMETDVMHTEGPGQPQGDNSNSSGKATYASMAAKGYSENGNQVPRTGFDFDEVVVLDEDCTVDQSGHYPTIRFSDMVLLDRIYGLWHLRGELQLIDLENNYYLVRFEDERDYADVLINGPWTIFGSYLTVQLWSRSLSTDEKYPSNIVVWVRLPSLPYRYYCKALFRRIAHLVGRVIKVDYNTKAGERGKFARLAIMVDLKKPITSCIGIDNFVQKIEYEGLQQICYSCGKYGHAEDICATLSFSMEVPRSDRAASVPNHTADGSNNSLYGPWMIANTRRRRVSKATYPETSNAAAHNQYRCSRFAALHMEEDVDATDGRRVQEPGVLLPPSAEVSQGQHRTGARSEGTVPRQAISKNTAYLVPNPDRKSKKVAAAKDITGELNVVPSSSEHAASVIPHNVQRGSNNHNAILIVESRYEANNGSHSRSCKGRGKGSKGPGKIQRKGFKLHRQTKTKSAGNRVPSSWVKEFADQIDVLAANEHVPPDTSVNRDRLETDMDYSSDDGDDFVDSSLEKSNDGVGATSSTFRRIFNSLVREYNPEVVALFVPQVFGKAADRVIHRFGFAHSFRVESHGFSGGLWVLWKENIAVEIVDISNQFINGRFRHEDARNWIQFTAIYASPNGTKQKQLWDQLASLDPGDATPWILGGYFNLILDGGERVGGSDSVSGGSRRFGEFIQTNGLVDQGFQGPPFTWSRGNLKQRLDGCLANAVWCNEFPNSRVIHLERRGSDHRPLLLRLRPDLVRKGHRPFRYIASWQEHADFKSILKDNWKDDVFVGDNISSLKPAVSKWNVEVFGHIGQKKRRLLARLRGIDNALAKAHSNFLVSLADQLQMKLFQVLEQGESFWQQKACSKWILYGDRNTKYYHALTMNRRRSRLWKGLSVIWCDVRIYVRIRVGDGISTNFWRDSWIAGIDPLIGYVPERLAHSLDYVSVASMADCNGNWLWHKFEHLLPLNTRLRIAAAGCPMAIGVWTSLIKPDFLSPFLTMNVKEWVYLNLTDAARMVNHPEDWDLLFGSICWNLWLERNAMVFDNPLDDRGTVLE